MVNTYIVDYSQNWIADEWIDYGILIFPDPNPKYAQAFCTKGLLGQLGTLRSNAETFYAGRGFQKPSLIYDGSGEYAPNQEFAYSLKSFYSALGLGHGWTTRPPSANEALTNLTFEARSSSETECMIIKRTGDGPGFESYAMVDLFIPTLLDNNSDIRGLRVVCQAANRHANQTTGIAISIFQYDRANDDGSGTWEDLTAIAPAGNITEVDDDGTGRVWGVFDEQFELSDGSANWNKLAKASYDGWGWYIYNQKDEWLADEVNGIRLRIKCEDRCDNAGSSAGMNIGMLYVYFYRTGGATNQYPIVDNEPQQLITSADLTAYTSAGDYYAVAPSAQIIFNDFGDATWGADDYSFTFIDNTSVDFFIGAEFYGLSHLTCINILKEAANYMWWYEPEMIALLLEDRTELIDSGITFTNTILTDENTSITYPKRQVIDRVILRGNPTLDISVDIYSDYTDDNQSTRIFFESMPHLSTIGELTTVANSLLDRYGDLFPSVVITLPYKQAYSSIRTGRSVTVTYDIIDEAMRVQRVVYNYQAGRGLYVTIYLGNPQSPDSIQIRDSLNTLKSNFNIMNARSTYMNYGSDYLATRSVGSGSGEDPNAAGYVKDDGSVPVEYLEYHNPDGENATFRVSGLVPNCTLDVDFDLGAHDYFTTGNIGGTDSTWDGDAIPNDKISELSVRQFENLFEVLGSKLTDDVPDNRVPSTAVRQWEGEFEVKGSLVTDTVPNIYIPTTLTGKTLTNASLGGATLTDNPTFDVDFDLGSKNFLTSGAVTSPTVTVENPDGTNQTLTASGTGGAETIHVLSNLTCVDGIFGASSVTIGDMLLTDGGVQDLTVEGANPRLVIKDNDDVIGTAYGYVEGRDKDHALTMQIGLIGGTLYINNYATDEDIYIQTAAGGITALNNLSLNNGVTVVDDIETTMPVTPTYAQLITARGAKDYADSLGGSAHDISSHADVGTVTDHIGVLMYQAASGTWSSLTPPDTVGNVLRCTNVNGSMVWQQLGHSDLSGLSGNPHGVDWDDVKAGHTAQEHNTISVTALSDVTSAGSGIIISDAERTALHPTYTNANAISAVQGEATLELGAQVKIDSTGWLEQGSTPAGTVQLEYNGYFYATRVYNAVYNDYADFWGELKDGEKAISGKVYATDIGKIVKIADKRADIGALGICSDTYGFASGMNVGEVPLAVAGFVLAYVDNEYPSGTRLVNDKNGHLTKAKPREKIDAIAKFVTKENDKYLNSKTERITVDNRCWVKVL